MPSPERATTWVPLSRVTQQSNSLAPWFEGTFGFRSVTTEVPQCLPISHLLSLKDFRVTAETGDRLSAHLSGTRSRIISFEAESQVRGVLGLVTY